MGTIKKEMFNNKTLLVSTLVDIILEFPFCHNNLVKKLKQQLRDIFMKCLMQSKIWVIKQCLVDSL